MAKPKKRRTPVPAAVSPAEKLLIASVIFTLVAVPLIFTTSVHRIYSLPRFVVLLIGSSLILVALAWVGNAGKPSIGRFLKTRHCALVFLLLAATALATALGVAPVASLFGSFENQMGLITRVCFVICFAGLIVAVGASRERLRVILWSMTLTGLLVAAYATAQFFGIDPFVPSSLYTFGSPFGSVVRVSGTLGHSNYLGNFLLYTTPISAALALSGGGQARRIAFAATILSAAAIIFSGTRGAWIGLVAAGVVFFWSERGFDAETVLKRKRKQLILQSAGVLAAVVLLIWLTISAGSSAGLVVRAKSFVTDSFSGSGRTLLWRDAVKMVPRYAITGVGPEAFRKAFLGYKSKDLAQLAPQINNESSHNTYLDAAINTGIPGLILYTAVLGSAFLLLLRARSRAADRRDRLITSGLLAALGAVVVHNIFIFDQIPTGLYYVLAIGLAQAAWNVSSGDPIHSDHSDRSSNASRSRIGTAVLAAAMAIALAASWYGLALLRADVALKRAFAAATSGNVDEVMQQGRVAAGAPDPTGSYHLMFAQALMVCLDATKSAGSSAKPALIETATREAEQSLRHSLTTESSNLLIAYIAYLGGDVEKQRRFAEEAIKWDPYYPNSRWLLAEALLAQGDREAATREAERALDIDSSTSAARSVRRRARGEDKPRTIDGMIEVSRLLAGQGRIRKAERYLIRALRKTEGACPECHRELALLYESSGDMEKAIAAWEAYLNGQQISSNDDARARLAELKKRQAAR